MFTMEDDTLMLQQIVYWLEQKKSGPLSHYASIKCKSYKYYANVLNEFRF